MARISDLAYSLGNGELRMNESFYIKCRQCNGDGWYLVDDNHGGAKQEQCEYCYGEGKTKPTDGKGIG